MEHISVTAVPRSAKITKGELKRMRREGQVPAALFGRGIETELVSVDAHALRDVLTSDAGENTLVDLTLDGNKHLVKLTEVELDPVQRTFLHVGLHKIARNEVTKASIPIELEGEPEASRMNVGVLEQATNTIDVRCLPEQLVAAIHLDISEMQVGDVKYVSDLALPDGYELLSPADAPVASLQVARVVEEVEETATDEETLGADTGTAAEGESEAGAAP